MKTIDEYVKTLIDDPAETGNKLLKASADKLEGFIRGRPSELRGFKEHLQQVQDFEAALKSVELNLSLDSIAQIISNDIEELYVKWCEEKTAKSDALCDEMDALIAKIEQENKQANDELRNSLSASNEVYQQLEDKHKTLMSYSNKIIDMCQQYGVTSGDVNIDNDTFTIEQMNNLYDKYINFLEKDEKSSNVITWLRHAIQSKEVQGVILIVLLFICFTPLLDLLAVACFGFIGWHQYKNRNIANYYIVLMGLAFNVDPLKLGYKDLDESLLLPETLTDEMVDNDERFADFEGKFDAIDEEYAKTNPQNFQMQLLSEFEAKRETFVQRMNDAIAKFNQERDVLHDKFAEELKFLQGEYDRLKSEFKTLGDRFSYDYTFNPRFVCGIHDDVIEETIDIGLNNVIIRPSANENVMNKFLQCMVANALSNTFPGKLVVHVVDPNNFGRCIMPLYKAELGDVIKFHNKDLASVLNELTDYAQSNFKDMQGKDLQTFNKICQDTGKTSKEWHLLLILSQPKTVEEDEALNAFFQYSVSGGVMIWIVSDIMKSQNAYLIRKPFEGIKNPFAFLGDEWCNKFATRFLSEVQAAKPAGLLWQDFINNVLPIDRTWSGDASKYINFYPGYHDGDPSLFKPYTLGNDGNVHAIGVGTSGAGKSVFLNHIIGTMCREFDPSQLELWLCDFKGVEFKAYMKTPRAKAARLCKPIVAGEGYAPKSDEKMQEVLGYYAYNKDTKEYTYSENPTEDCKELCVFMQDIKNGKPKEKKGKVIPPRPKADTSYAPNMEEYCLPHIAACLCTSDGDFATSLFKAYRDKADARYEDMKILGVKNMPGWNSRVKTLIGSEKPKEIVEAHGKETGFNPIWSEADIWPRVLFVCDEFQVIFQKADEKNVAKIKADITQIAKVARACGMHIFFTSQSMKGTISSDILANFTLRFALRCEAEVSMDIIGTKRAAEIKEKNGYLIVQSQEMKTAEDQKRYKTPFLCDDENSGKDTMSELFDNIRYLYNLAKERGFKERDVISYEEATKHPIEQLDDWYKNPLVMSKLPDSGVFFIGPRMAYSPNRAPENIILGNKNNTHIMACFPDMTDYVFFFNTIVRNIKNNKVPGTTIINSQVADLSYICDAESYITNEEQKPLLSEKVSCDEFYKWLKGLYDYRKANEIKDKPVWIILMGWDKGKGYGVDTDPSLRNNLNILLQTMGELNMHIIFLMSGMSGIARSTVEACKYRMCGKADGDASSTLLGTNQAAKSYEMEKGWLFMWNDNKVSRDKLYISNITREIQSDTIVI